MSGSHVHCQPTRAVLTGTDTGLLPSCTAVPSASCFHDETVALVELEAALWPHGPVCPRCGGMERITAVKGGRMGLRRCGPCKRQFTVTIGTMFEASHVPLNLWLQAIHLMRNSRNRMSGRQLMQILSVQYRTAWFMARRIRGAMLSGKLPPVGNTGMAVPPGIRLPRQ